MSIVDRATGAARALAARLPGASGGAASDDDGAGRWRAVTVDRPQEEVAPGGRLPAPLADLGDAVEVQLRPAPGGKGTEVAARLREPEPSGLSGAALAALGEDPRQAVRSALRQAKQLVEVGEVLRVDPAPHGRRTATPAGAAIDAATRRAGGEGVL